MFGNIYLTDKQGAETFDEEDERVLVVLATQAAIAVENARLYDETERKGRELQRLQVMEERERIGKELHDGVIQSLFAVGMSLQGLASSSRRRRDRAAPRSGGRGRRSRDPRPAQLHLRSAPGHPRRPPARSGAQGDGERVRRRTGVVTVVDVDGEVASRARLARRRRGAARARGALERRPARGGHHVPCLAPAGARAASSSRSTTTAGGSTSTMTSWGMGLHNLRERVESLGGVLEVESTPSRGTTVRLTLTR